ncbi:MAG: AmmeMemoRadiSam system radical SAM enzyme [Candidatus Riflebacteria bacterium]|nr:AmmeMemoRadiSam system radical SAM enzyme [Candidatus Riflebacteria bacterium]
MKWSNGSRVARHWQKLDDGGSVQCGLCPRHCRPGDGELGFCGTRGNVHGELHTYNYGRAVHLASERIETEAVVHYAPGARTLCLGNVGCMLTCSFCQNWETSQISFLDPKHVQEFTPEEVIAIARLHGIQFLSWTYNDPVVWQEFVLETARLGLANGIKSIYKSAFYIEEAPVRELLDVIEVFTLSLKSMAPTFYRQHTKGTLEPVLKATEIVYGAGKHLEVSNLLVTGLNDSEADMRAMARWCVEHIPGTPLHVVRFHPAFQYADVSRTPFETVLRAREIALEEGVGHLLVERFGLTTTIRGIGSNGLCARCGARTPIKHPFAGHSSEPAGDAPVSGERSFEFQWTSENSGLHVVAPDRCRDRVPLSVKRLPGGSMETIWLGHRLTRILISKGSAEETGVEVSWDGDLPVSYLPTLDRAHYPVESTVGPAHVHLSAQQ